ncbi:hypothetical protein [Erythrobacter crassostreae]|uniref:SnoaL-like domain-containing protein n=1 Tax=Erythrobacter crassostreae TaxID=2828328 RepID=A0A9X1JJL4_9SPHN|nr:hypothetical protein [Erythrobacter crassostrea]MBV7258070.1 hypothetical protein [Erythrobacter crassostrea]
MIRSILAAALAVTATAASAQLTMTPTDSGKVMLAAADFIDAIGSDDKSALAQHMIPEGTIFVHNRMDPDNPRVDIVSVADHLERWSKGKRKTSERMDFRRISVDGDMAQVWGPYSFEVDGKLTHCGVNSLSMVKTESGWKVANTSFTMVPPSDCYKYGMHWIEE